MHRRWPGWIQGLMVFALPLALLAASLRITTSPWLVYWEYGKASFPADPFGFDTEERIRLAEVSVDYLISGAGIDLLADLETEGGPAFNTRELQHMVDVKKALRGLLWAGMGTGLVVVLGTVLLAIRPATRWRAPAALLSGSLLGLGLLAAVGAVMVFQWDVFFTGFHNVFFASGTWTFAYSDTLIRLFPVRFWMDVAAVIVSLLVGLSIAVGGGAYFWKRSLRGL